jgi:hypothetical protein
MTEPSVRISSPCSQNAARSSSVKFGSPSSVKRSSPAARCWTSKFWMRPVQSVPPQISTPAAAAASVTYFIHSL